MLSDKVKSELLKDLDSSIIKTRKQGTAQVAYLEGSQVIRDLNKIFGFDGWSFEITDEKMLVDSTREVEDKYKGGQKTQYFCSYRVTGSLIIDGVIKSDIGLGDGVAYQPTGHYSMAVKGASTDALKRCARQFGNRFGLALYFDDHSGIADYTQDEKNEEYMKREEEKFMLDRKANIVTQSTLKLLNKLTTELEANEDKNIDWMIEKGYCFAKVTNYNELTEKEALALVKVLKAKKKANNATNKN